MATNTKRVIKTNTYVETDDGNSQRSGVFQSEINHIPAKSTSKGSRSANDALSLHDELETRYGGVFAQHIVDCLDKIKTKEKG